MNFTQAVNNFLRKYVVFTGRASRSEYWYAYLFYAIMVVLAMIGDFSLTIQTLTVDSNVEAPITFLSSLIGVILFFPILTVAIRRLHDTNRSGWWLLMIFVPLIGVIALIVFFCQRGTEGTNRFGEDTVGSGQVAPAERQCRTQ